MFREMGRRNYQRHKEGRSAKTCKRAAQGKASWHPPFQCKDCNFSHEKYHLNMCLPSGETSLTAAVLDGLVECVELLLTHGATPDVPSACGETPLAIAARSQSTRIVQLLLAAGATPNTIDSRYNMTPLQAAVYYQQVDIVKLLLKHGVIIQPGNDTLRLAIGLDECSSPQQLAMTTLLLDHGAGVNEADVYGNTPFLTACNTGNLQVVQLFLQHGADLQQHNKNGCTALELAIFTHRCYVAQYLVAEHHSRGIPIHRCCLLGAIAQNCMTCFELCMEQSLDISAPFPNRGHVTPVLFAMQSSPKYMCGIALRQDTGCSSTEERLPMVQRLIEAGVTLGHWWQQDIFDKHCRPRTSEKLFELLVCASGLNVTGSDVCEVFQKCFCDGLIRCCRLLCRSGFTPNDDDDMRVMENLWRRIDTVEKKEILQEIKDIMEDRQVTPRTLQDCCVSSVRALLNDNVIYKVTRLNLPYKIRNMITLNEYK